MEKKRKVLHKKETFFMLFSIAQKQVLRKAENEKRKNGRLRVGASEKQKAVFRRGCQLASAPASDLSARNVLRL